MECGPATAGGKGSHESDIFSGARACEDPRSGLGFCGDDLELRRRSVGGGTNCMPRRLSRSPFNRITASLIQRRIMWMFCPQPHMFYYHVPCKSGVYRDLNLFVSLTFLLHSMTERSIRVPVERWPSGLRRACDNRYRHLEQTRWQETASRVRIPVSPPLRFNSHRREIPLGQPPRNRYMQCDTISWH